MKRFVIGDIHGAHRALLQCIAKSGIDRISDLLICIGDVSDGWPDTPESFDELLSFDNLIYIIGNHDEWLYQWFKFDTTPLIWTSQGGQATIDAYKRRFDEKPEMGFTALTVRHLELLTNAPFYHVTEDNKCFVHGGFDWHYPIKHTLHKELMWDRDLFEVACMWQRQADRGFPDPNGRVKEFDEVFIGHTTTSYTDSSLKPVHASNVWNIDQGAGWEGKLTILDIDSKEYWQSDIVTSLYPNIRGR